MTRLNAGFLLGLLLVGCGQATPSLSPQTFDQAAATTGALGLGFKEASYQSLTLAAFDQYDKRLLRPGHKYRLEGNLTHMVLPDASGRSAGRLEWYLFDGTREKPTGVGRSVHLSDRQMNAQLKWWPSRAAGNKVTFDGRLNVTVFVSVVAQDYPLRIDAIKDAQGRLIRH